jgi:hypothetical protein
MQDPSTIKEKDAGRYRSLARDVVRAFAGQFSTGSFVIDVDTMLPAGTLMCVDGDGTDTKLYINTAAVVQSGHSWRYLTFVLWHECRHIFQRVTANSARNLLSSNSMRDVEGDRILGGYFLVGERLLIMPDEVGPRVVIMSADEARTGQEAMFQDYTDGILEVDADRFATCLFNQLSIPVPKEAAEERNIRERDSDYWFIGRPSRQQRRK